MKPTYDEARTLFAYDPTTGHLTRKTKGGLGRKPTGTRGGEGYLQTSICGKRYMVHHIAWLLTHKTWPRYEIDHRNQVKDDNRLLNLRDVTHPQNCHNKGMDRRNKSGYPGVSWNDARKLWTAQIGAYGQIHYLGRFATAALASAAYQAAKTTYHPTAPVAQQGA